MHVRAATVQVQSGKMQEAIDIFKDSVVPAQKAQNGYQGSYLMTDAGSGKCLAISVWESEADMMAGSPAAAITSSRLPSSAALWPVLPTWIITNLVLRIRPKSNYRP